MKFNYPDIKTVSVDGLRLYVIPDGNFYPSITTILGKTQKQETIDALNKWRAWIGDDVERLMKEITDKGEAVHLMAERFLKNEPVVVEGDDFSEDAISSFNGLKLHLRKIEEVWGLEVALYSHEISLAGRCDCIAMHKGHPTIIDFKTSRSLKGDDRIGDYRLQLCAYAIMHNEMFGTNITRGTILMTSMNGFPQEFNINLMDYREELQARIDQFYESM